MAEAIMFDVTVVALAERRDALAALLRTTMAGSRAEAGCLVYRFAADLDDPDRFYLVELWESEAALQAHASGTPFRTFLAELPSCGRVVASVARAGTLRPYSFRRPDAPPAA